MFDDIDDAFESRPSLLQEMDIDRRQDMVHALAFIRILNDHARKAQNVVQAEINNLQVRYAPANNLAPADLDAADGEQ